MNENIKGLLVPTPYKRKYFFYGLLVSHIVGSRRRGRTYSSVIVSMAGVGMSGQWIEAEGRGSAAGAPEAIFYFLFFWMVEDVVHC